MTICCEAKNSRPDFPDTQATVLADLTNCTVFQAIPDNGSKE